MWHPFFSSCPCCRGQNTCPAVLPPHAKSYFPLPLLHLHYQLLEQCERWEDTALTVSQTAFVPSACWHETLLEGPGGKYFFWFCSEDSGLAGQRNWYSGTESTEGRVGEKGQVGTDYFIMNFPWNSKTYRQQKSWGQEDVNLWQNVVIAALLQPVILQEDK